MISALTERAFAACRQGDWARLEQLVHRVASKGLRALALPEIVAIAPLYRDACADLAAAQAARYSGPLVEYLQDLTATAHTVLYDTRGRRWGASSLGAGIRSAFGAFPRAARSHSRAVLLSALFFFVPLAIGALAALRDPTFALRIVPEESLRSLADAYAKGFLEGRAAGEGAAMAGFYVNNNVGIALRVFALGIFGGLGSAFYLIDNGLSIGAVTGYVTSEGAGSNIFTFVVGHGSFELTAIVLAGSAGLSLGWSVVAPGDKTRAASLQAVAPDVAIIALGAGAMLLLAAMIEAFWSGSSVPSEYKQGVGAMLWMSVTGYLVFAGRPPNGSRARWT